MKRYLAIGIVILFSMVGNGCKKDNTSPATSTTTEPLAGNWRVSSFINEGSDKTSQFAGYTFNCTLDGVLTIHDSSHTYNCSWSYEDSNHSMCNFHIMGCDNNSVLWECDDDWDLTSHNASSCHFSKHNPNHHGTMTWTKI